MTIYELRNAHEKNNRGSHFFDDATLKFFGESLSKMRVLKKTTRITDILGIEHDCIIVSSTRNKNAFGRCKPYVKYLYFDCNTFEDITL